MTFSFKYKGQSAAIVFWVLQALALNASLLVLTDELQAASNIPPQLIEQAKLLSPAEQRELARQYGVALPQGAAAPLPKKAEMGNEPLVQNRISGSAPDNSLEPQIRPNLKRFGAQLFAGDFETYAPLDRALAPSGYLLGAGDELSIQVFGKDPIETFVQVDRTGQIAIPKIGAISVAGLTFEEAKRVIANSVNTRLIGSEVVTALGSLRQISIFLAGEVNAPGNYNVSALTSISQALYMSGGLTSIGSFRNIQVRRGGVTVTQFDFYDLLLKGQRDNDITLQSGDTVFVPVAHSIVSIDGAIKRPALYELKGGESFKEVIDMAGGLTATAFEQMSTIQRFDSEKGYPVVLTITDPMSDLSIIDGDIITIKEGTRQLANAIELKGAVVRPGVYAHSEGARISDYIGFIDRDLMIDADLEVGLIVRRINDRLDIEVLAFDVVSAAGSRGSDLDPELQVFDQIIILPISNAEEGADSGITRAQLISPVVEKLRNQAGQGSPVAVVSLQGAVKEPGEYPIVQGGSLSFLIQLAGGLADGAYLQEVEIRRINASESGATIEVLKTNMETEFSFTLQSRDVVRINYLPDWNPDASVEILGEVVFPGSYALRDNETIGSLIVRAGGFSSEAFPKATRYTSKSTRDQQRIVARKLIERVEREQISRQSVGDARIDESNPEEFNETLLDSFQGRLVVDVPRILAGDASADVLLQDGDKIVVPKLVESITVAGEVYEPGSFRFEAGLSFSDYIELAAGMTDRARKKDIYIIEVNGAVVRLENNKRELFRFDRNVSALTPGAVIVVPTNFDYEKPINRYRTITSVVFESVASVAAFFSIANK